MAKFYIEAIEFARTEDVENVFKELLLQPIDTVEQLEAWLVEQSRVFDMVEEAMSGHYIDFQCQSDSKEAKDVFEHDQTVIDPLYKKYVSLLNDKFLASQALDELDPHVYKQLMKRKQNEKDIFRVENIELEIEEDGLATNYFEHTGSLTIKWGEEELTLSQIAPFLEDPDRQTRKKAFSLATEALLSKEKELQSIMNQLISLRTEKAKNAGEANFRDYMFKKYERFDYTPQDCMELARSIEKHVKPLKEKLQKKHQEELGVDHYRPWDRQAVSASLQPLQPFSTPEELIKKTATILTRMDQRFVELLLNMNERGMLDLTSRKGKAPGGFCSALPLSELSFIFMNASRTHDDVITLIHEMGHCIHNDLMSNQKIGEYRDVPMESAELASMSMELLTMDQWHLFYENEADVKRAKKEHLKGIIDFLPQGMVIDQFQHWLYENPLHSEEERNQMYQKLLQRIDSEVVDWSGYDSWQQTSWLKVLHIFEVPFYYIEYVIAQLGAVQMYRQYKQDPKKALNHYKQALSLGSSKSLPEVYKAAGIQFDFSEKMVKELMLFLEEELNDLY